jgi:hypothetical protein
MPYGNKNKKSVKTTIPANGFDVEPTHLKRYRVAFEKHNAQTLIIFCCF